jgi:hypothetical protein
MHVCLPVLAALRMQEDYDMPLTDENQPYSKRKTEVESEATK